MSALAALMLAGAVAPVPATPLPDAPAAKLEAGLAACSSRAGWEAAMGGKDGWTRGSSYSLVARGQRAHEFQREASGGKLTLHSSFILFVACSTSVDLATPEEEGPFRDGLVAQMALKPAKLGDLALSDNAKAFVQEYGLGKEAPLFANDTMAWSFKLRQFNGRNIFAAYAIELEKAK